MTVRPGNVTFESLIQRINAACRQFGTTYSRFIEGLVAAKIEVDRKVLADLAVTDEATFKAIFDKAIAALERKNAPEVGPPSWPFGTGKGKGRALLDQSALLRLQVLICAMRVSCFR